LSQRLQDATKARIEAQHIKEDVQGMTDASTEELMTIPAVLRHQLLRDLKRDQSGAERKLAELGKRYGLKHPSMLSAMSDVSAANAALAREVRKVVSGISHEYAVALRNEQQLQANWEARKSEMQSFNRVEFRLQELQRDVDANRQLYDIFFTRIKGVSETGGFERPHARIVDRALTPTRPVKPNKRMSVTLAFILGILLGCGVAILLDVLDNTVKSPDDVSDKLRVPLLGTVPRQRIGKTGEFEQLWQNAQSPFAEAIRTLRTGVVLSSLDEPARIIVVTSTVPGEGKSTIALNLAVALGQMENTLVIGADLRRPSLAQKCKLAPNHLGLSHFVSGTAELEDCIEHKDALGVHVMPAGVIPPNPLEMISSKKFVDALEVLREKFDRIVIDSAPVQAVSDALILASYADSVVYVIKADATAATDVYKGINSIVGSNEPLTGVVLNHFDMKRAGRYYSGPSYEPGGYGQNTGSEKA
jgi:succinoglycan biosynthesis transport protein ExoP